MKKLLMIILGLILSTSVLADTKVIKKVWAQRTKKSPIVYEEFNCGIAKNSDQLKQIQSDCQDEVDKLNALEGKKYYKISAIVAVIPLTIKK